MPVIDIIPLNTDFLISIKNTPRSVKIYLLFPFDRYILTDWVCNKTDFTFSISSCFRDFLNFSIFFIFFRQVFCIKFYDRHIVITGLIIHIVV